MDQCTRAKILASFIEGPPVTSLRRKKTPKKDRSTTARIAQMLSEVVMADMKAKTKALGMRVGFQRSAMDWICMVLADRASRARIQPGSLDIANGRDALLALYATLTDRDFTEQKIVRCTPQWMYVVRSARAKLAYAVRQQEAADAANHRAWMKSTTPPMIPRAPKKSRRRSTRMRTSS